MDWRKRYGMEPRIRTAADPLGLRFVCCSGLPAAYNQFIHRLQRYFLNRFYRDLNLRGAKALDGGCGTGRWSRHLRARGATVTGVDLSPTVIRSNRALAQHRGIRFTAASLTRLPFPKASFDFVQTVTVIQHMPPAAQARAAAELCRITRPGGRIMIHETVRPADSPDAGVTWPRTPREWEAMFARHGWRCVRSERAFFVPLMSLLVAVKRVVKRLAFGKSRPGARADGVPTDVRGASQAFTRWYFWLATYPSYVLEFVFFLLLGGRHWTTQRVLGDAQTFLFARKD